MTCGHTLSWYELIPLFSYLFLGGKCRHCKAHISVQYPIVEAANGILYVVFFLAKGITVETFLYCLAASALLALSVIDWRTQAIPNEICGEIWREPCQQEVQQEPVLYLLLAGSLGWEC